ncbi:hypothetical protein L208DRAFT_1400049 [Tricholoma matsutake]|nr:hypothetical protein L208DRAFT_1400049 [Tricholoma matsutake 945]
MVQKPLCCLSCTPIVSCPLTIVLLADVHTLLAQLHPMQTLTMTQAMIEIEPDGAQACVSYYIDQLAARIHDAKWLQR